MHLLTFLPISTVIFIFNTNNLIVQVILYYIINFNTIVVINNIFNIKSLSYILFHIYFFSLHNFNTCIQF